jgi:hypothetical protein
MSEQTYLTTNDDYALECLSCGCLVVNTEQHNLWHTKTRSQV